MSFKRALAWSGAIAAALCGIVLLWDVVLMVRVFYPFFLTVHTGSGGMGAVSAGAAAQISIALLGLIPSVIVNRWLAKRSRDEHRRVRTLYRLHSTLLLVVAAGVVLLVLAIPLGAFLSFPGMFSVGLITLFAIGAQFLVLAGLLVSVA